MPKSMAASQSNFATFSLKELRRKGNFGAVKADSYRILDRTDRTLHRRYLLDVGDPRWMLRAIKVPIGWRTFWCGPLFVLIRPNVICVDHLIWHTNISSPPCTYPAMYLAVVRAHAHHRPSFSEYTSTYTRNGTEKWQLANVRYEHAFVVAILFSKNLLFLTSSRI